MKVVTIILVIAGVFICVINTVGAGELSTGSEIPSKADSALVFQEVTPQQRMVKVPGCILKSFQMLLGSLDGKLQKDCMDAYTELIDYVQKNNCYAPFHVLYFSVIQSLFIAALAHNESHDSRMSDLIVMFDSFKKFLAVRTDECFCGCPGVCNCSIPCQCSWCESQKADDPCVQCTSNPWFCCPK